LLLAATAINLKRLISRPRAAENTADGRDHAQNAAIDTRNAARRRAIAAHLAIIAACLRALDALDAANSTASTTGS
jgi:hypothetical protein